MDSHEILTALLKKAEVGELPKKKADMLVNLQSKIATGLPITEMQAELLEDLGARTVSAEAGRAAVRGGARLRSGSVRR